MCVVGMHRSGTSATARVVNLLGVHWGDPANLMAAEAADNPRGYWEQNWVVQANDAVLARLGGSWMAPPPLRPGWERSPAFRGMAEQIGTLLGAAFPPGVRFGFKDPRLSLTMPLWRPMLGEPCAIVCVRHPAEVARSLERRGLGASRDAWVRLWWVYTWAAIATTDGMPTRVLPHLRLLTRPEESLDELAAFLGLADRARDPQVRAAVLEHVDGGLWRNRAGDDEAPLLPGAGELYRALVAVADAGGEGLADLRALAPRARIGSRDVVAALEEIAERAGAVSTAHA